MAKKEEKPKIGQEGEDVVYDSAGGDEVLLGALGALAP